MEQRVGFLESRKEMKTKLWLYTQRDSSKKQNQFLILQHDETQDYYLFCVYCVCFGSKCSKGRLSDQGIQIKQAKDLRGIVTNHQDTLIHTNSEKEYLSCDNLADQQEIISMEFERIERNRFIVNEVIEALMHLITNSKYMNMNE